MKLIPQTPKLSLNKAFLKQRPKRSEIDLFKTNLKSLLDKIHTIESRPKDETEEHLKNDVRDFLRDTFYKDTHGINTKDKQDLVVHTAKGTDSKVGVIIEAKRPNNKAEMVSVDKPNAKALQELILYYLRERVVEGNIDIKYLVITNINEWYIFEAKYFEKLFFENKAFVKQFDEWRGGQKVTKNTNLFYNEIARPFIDKIEESVPCTYFNLNDYKDILLNESETDDKKLIALFKILSPHHLLKVPFADDSNKLDENFYKELLHIIGLEEAKVSGKLVIRRIAEGRNHGSLLENAIEQIKDELHRVTDLKNFGDTTEAQTFNIALELCITWINRILFLKLLEGQLVTYHKGDRNYRFLNSDTISDFDELSKLFHKVLAVNVNERSAAIQAKFSKVPYLNSSLFDSTDLEDQTIKINSLDPSLFLDFLTTTILKDQKKNTKQLPALDYLFKFLDSYDFASEGAEDIQENTKSLINASVLGKVFEKINGYKDGSIFTPGFITMYICRQTIRQSVVQKFNEVKKWQLKNFDDLYNKIEDIDDANKIINDLKICDPAVGSGHFLVSALNEIIAIKAELGLLKDKNGRRLKEYAIEVVNDELIVTDEDGDIFSYNPLNERSQRVQETLFTEKQTIIENCLFGVDINPKSVLICRLRLWIELLKNAYYKKKGNTEELETLPNIDINIKCGNSLLSRFSLDADISKALKSIKYDVKAYRGFVNDYKNERSREVKRGLQKIIDTIKSDFRSEIFNNDPKVLRLNKASGELFNLLNQTKLFDEDAKQKKKRKETQQKLEEEIEKLSALIEEIKTNAIYKNAFEWRFEFPEVLNNNGDFEGFDAIIGNPPYIQLQKLEPAIKSALLQQAYETFTATGDIYQLFYEKGVKILRQNGHLGYITSNKWMRTDYGGITRKFLSTQCNTQLVVDFGMAQLFDSATTYTNILLLSKSAPAENISMCRVTADYDDTVLLEDYIDFAAVTMPNPGEGSWVAYDKREYSLIQRIVLKGKPIKEWDIQINRGIVTGYNEAFIVNNDVRNKLVSEDPRSVDVLKPLLRGEDIKAFVPSWANLWLIYIPWHFPLHLDNSVTGSSEKAEKMFAESYPAIYRHLQAHKTKLSARNKTETGIRYEWYALQRWGSNYYQDFLKPKIIYPNMTKFMPFVYDKHQFFTNQKCFIITGQNLAYLTAFFNSRLFRFAFKEYFPELLGDTRELSKVFFETVTVKQVDAKTDLIFEKLVSDIENLKKLGKPTLDLEQEIETRLAEIYSLSTSEIALVGSKESLASPVEESIIERSSLVNS